MQVTICLSDIFSRIAAVLIVGLLLAWVTMVLGEWEIQETSKLSHTELQEYIKQGHDSSFPGNYLHVLILTSVYVACVEGVAFLIRIGARAMRPSGSEIAAGNSQVVVGRPREPRPA